MPRNFLNEVAKKLTKIVEDINNNSAAVTLEKEKGEKL
jgi:hypothetical protein